MSFETTAWALNVEADLTSIERLVLAVLADFKNATTGLCCPSYRSIAAKAGCYLGTAKRAVKALTQKGLITLERRFNSSSVYTLNETESVGDSAEDRVITAYGDTSSIGVAHSHRVAQEDHGVAEEPPNLELILELDPLTAKPIVSGVFTAPTLQEVKDFANENHLTVDPERFVSRNNATAWMIGGSPIFDWKELLFAWERMEPQFGRNSKPSITRGNSSRDRSIQEDLNDRSWAL